MHSGASKPAGPNKPLILGMFMSGVFVLVLAGFFLPLFAGHSALAYLDDLFNSLSKHSAYYIPQLREAAKKWQGLTIQVDLDLVDPGQAERVRLLLRRAGAAARPRGSQLEVTFDLGQILASCLDDADSMYHNRGAELVGRYQGHDERLMLYTWWHCLKRLEEVLRRHNDLPPARSLATVRGKAVETAYNYYKVEPRRIGEKWRVAAWGLVIYVLCTLWCGYGALFLFAGLGYRLER